MPGWAGGDDASDAAVTSVRDDYSYAPVLDAGSSVAVITPLRRDDYSPKYQARYSAEETSDAVYENDKRHRRCMERKRRAKLIMLSFLLLGVAGFVARIYLFFAGIRGRLRGDITMLHSHDLGGNQTSSFWNAWRGKAKPAPGFGRAGAESNGFFDAISDEEWMRMKSETKSVIDLQDGVTMRTSFLLSEGGANINSLDWWTDNWKVNFSCPNKVCIGGKCICDPKRILSIADEETKGRKRGHDKQKPCLIYVSGGSDMDFSNQFLDYSLARMFEWHDGQVAGQDALPCEVHLFAPNLQDEPEQRDGLFVHKWGFRPSNKESMGVAADTTTSIAFNTLDETAAELQHPGGISLLALDCEMCEWDIFKDILSLDEPPQQVLMQMHGTPYMANELFLAMQEAGYVIFHRQQDSDGGGEVFDYSWIKLSPTFFNW
ncbi:hypothetical protein ACHAXT_000972 [Thalassiosira profunda]